MRKFVTVFVVVVLFVLTAMPAAAAPNNPNACFGQASAVFARMGAMGEHSSSFPTPRLGLRNLARALADAGAIPDDSMASLGQFVTNELGLSIAACGN